MWGVMAILAMVGFVGLVAVRLFPLYFDDFKVTTALNTIKVDADNSRTSADITTQFFRNLSIDNVNCVRQEDLQLDPKGDGSFALRLDYEVRVPIAYNVDAVVKFSHHQVVR